MTEALDGGCNTAVLDVTGQTDLRILPHSQVAPRCSHPTLLQKID